MEFYLAMKKNEILSFGNKWMEQENIILTRLTRPKIIFSSSYENFRPKTNAVILFDMGHMLSGEYIHEE
jgi:hypothetical protein